MPPIRSQRSQKLIEQEGPLLLAIKAIKMVNIPLLLLLLALLASQSQP